MVYGVAVPLQVWICKDISIYAKVTIEGINATMDVKPVVRKDIFLCIMNFPMEFNITIAFSKYFLYGTNCTIIVDFYL